MGLTGKEQFLRVAKVTIFNEQGLTRDLTGLRCKFKIEKTSESTANTAQIDIFNLSKDSRTFLEGKKMRIRLEAGYPESLEIIAAGDITKAVSRHEYPEWITTVESGDGQTALREEHLDLSWSPGTPFQAIIGQATKALGVTVGPSLFVVPDVAAGGFSFSGTAKNLMDVLAKRFGLNWSIQDGAVQVHGKGKPVPGTAVVISGENGLVGNVIKTDAGIEFKTLLNGEIKPGKFVSVLTASLKGFYVARRVTLDGDTHDGPWFSMVEAEPIS